jgi:hypothetical protein
MSLSFPRERTVCLLTFAVCAALHAWFATVGWRNNLLEGHEFRQTQTAITAHYLQQDGWQLDYPLPLFGPPWSAPLEFTRYPYCDPPLSTQTGLPLEPTGRLVALAFFYLTLPALFLLLRHLALPAPRRWLFLGLILVSPVYLYYSRSFMIESSALCAAAWFLHAYCRAIETRGLRWIGWAALLGISAALLKITTLLMFLVPAAWFTLWHLWQIRPAVTAAWRPSFTTIAVAFTATLPGVLAALVWIHHGDAVKAGNPLSHFLLSTELHAWTYGYAGQRFSPAFWASIFTTTATTTLQVANLLMFVTFALLIGRSRRWTAAGLLLCFLAGPLVLANLYLIHDYYYYATGLFLLAGLTLAWSELLDLPNVPSPGKWLVIALCLTAQVLAFTHSYLLLQTPPRPEPPELARVLPAITERDDVILIYGLEWNPILPYYAQRRAIMVANQYFGDDQALQRVIARLPKGRIAALVVVGDLRNRTDYLWSLARSLNLSDRPLLSSSDTQCFLAQRLIPSALKILQNIPLHTLALAAPADSDIPGVKRVRYTVAKLEGTDAFDMMHPMPVEVVAPFGIAASVVDGHRVFNAHAPTEVIFQLPPGARAVQTGYGLLPTAYENGHALEGVRFLVELIRPSGERTVLFDQFLNPSHQPADRGMHQTQFNLPAHAEGRIIFSTLPGPNHNISFNWAYWTDLTIR